MEDRETGLIKAVHMLEEDFYLGSSDKLMFLMRDAKASLHPDRVAREANPFLVAKLPVTEVAKFDFPRIKVSEVDGYEDLSDEKLIIRLIAMAQNAVSRNYGEEEKPHPDDSNRHGDDHEKDSDDERERATKI